MRRIQRCAKCRGYYRPVFKNICPYCLKDAAPDKRPLPRYKVDRLTKKMEIEK